MSILMLLSYASADPLLLQFSDPVLPNPCSDNGFMLVGMTRTEGGKVTRSVEVLVADGARSDSASIPVDKVPALLSMLSGEPPAAVLDHWERRDVYGGFTFSVTESLTTLSASGHACRLTRSEAPALVGALKAAADLASK